LEDGNKAFITEAPMPKASNANANVKKTGIKANATTTRTGPNHRGAWNDLTSIRIIKDLLTGIERPGIFV